MKTTSTTRDGYLIDVENNDVYLKGRFDINSKLF